MNKRRCANDFIRIRDARQNNLQGLDLDLPTGKLIVVTGLSGAGKSSLVFDTLHAEGQRRYVETFSPYTRQFLELLPAPAVGAIENIRPSIAVQQGNSVKTSRSTVGTMTELCDWLKVWFAHRAELRDPKTGERVRAWAPESVWEEVAVAGAVPCGCPPAPAAPAPVAVVAFAVVKPAALSWAQVLGEFEKQGYSRALPASGAGEPVRFAEVAAAGSAGGTLAGAGELLLVQDRIALEPENKARFVEAAEKAFALGAGKITVIINGERREFRDTLTNAAGERFRPAFPALFSFNSPVGACPKCRGFGRVIGIDWGKVIPDESLSLAGGAIAPFAGKIYSESLRDLLRCAGKAGVPADVSWRDLDARQRAWVIDGEPGYGTGNVRYPKAWYGVKEFFKWLENTSYKMHVRVFLSRWRSYATCDECGGARLRPEALCWQWNGRTLPALYALPVTELLALLRPRNAPASRHPADQALAAAVARLGYLEDVGLGYLTLDRQSRTLSGGEAQRVNLTTCLGAALADALFVLDEPSIGLHPRDLDRMTGILRRLVAQGNTVVVVEHDESVMRAADFLVEIGPQPGAGGGRLVYAGNVAGIGKAKGSATGAWLSGRRTPVESRRRSVEKDDCSWWRVAGITSNNLRDFAVEIPLQRLVGLCGVSGSGKSSLVEALAGSALSSCGEATALSPRSPLPAPRSLPWSEAALIDQSPVSKTPRSNPALYSGAWDAIRKRLAADPAADAAGLTASHFSFNSGDGRCPHCGGSGWESVEMQFLADVHVPCPICDGHRFRPEILAFKHRGKTVSEILAMTISEALEFFADTAGAVRPLALLDEVGLGYLALGQPLNTLSGGEAQRLKLVRFLGGERGAGSGERGNSARNKKRGDVGEAQRSQSSPPVAVFCPLPLSLCPSSSILSPCSPLPAPCSLLLLDEPTTGLHRDDIARLIGVLQRLVDAGNTLFVVEHNADVLNACDYLLELGPGAGAAGGQLIAAAPPRILAAGNTPTAPYLRR